MPSFKNANDFYPQVIAPLDRMILVVISRLVDLRQVSFGLPLFLFHVGVHLIAIRGIESAAPFF